MISLPYFDPHLAQPVLEQFLRGTNEAVVCETTQGQLVAVNQRFLDLVGWAQPVQGYRLADLINQWSAGSAHPNSVSAYFERCRRGEGSDSPVELQPNPGQVVEARFHRIEVSGEQFFRFWFFQEWRTSALAWVSHEIKNPLNAVLGFSELLTDELRDSEVTDSIRESLRGLRIGTKHLHSVLGDLLDLSRLESGIVEPHLEWVDVATLVDELESLYRLRFQRRGLSFQIHPGPRTNGQILTDQRRLSQILGNLIANSLRFTHRGWVALKVEREGDQWTFHVEDSGVGIPKDQQETIFDPFVQKQGQDRQRFGGSGLGLAICRTLAQGLGASLALHSEPGVGSRFSLTFGQLQSRTLSPSAAQKPKNAPSRSSLLVADDEPSNHLLVRGYLRGTNITLLTAHDGRQAVELWRAHSPAVVLMDLRMPGVSGLEAARRIKGFDHEGKTRLLAMSATPPSRSEAAEGKSVWSGFLEKPFGKKDFLKFLSNHLSFVDESARSP